MKDKKIIIILGVVVLSLAGALSYSLWINFVLRNDTGISVVNVSEGVDIRSGYKGYMDKLEQFAFAYPDLLNISKYDPTELTNYSGDYDYKAGPDTKVTPNFVIDVDFFDKGTLDKDYIMLTNPIVKVGNNSFHLGSSASSTTDSDSYYGETYLIELNKGGYVQISHNCTTSRDKQIKVVKDNSEIGCNTQQKIVREMLETFKEI